MTKWRDECSVCLTTSCLKCLGEKWDGVTFWIQTSCVIWQLLQCRPQLECLGFCGFFFKVIVSLFPSLRLSQFDKLGPHTADVSPFATYCLIQERHIEIRLRGRPLFALRLLSLGKVFSVFSSWINALKTSRQKNKKRKPFFSFYFSVKSVNKW